MLTATRFSIRTLALMTALTVALPSAADTFPANWQELDHDELVALVASEERAAAFDSWAFDDAERAALAEHLWANHLSDEDYLAGHGSFALILFAKAAAPMLDQEQRAAVEAQLRKIADNPEFVKALDTRRQWRLWAVMRELGEADEVAAQRAVDWVLESERWHEDSAARFNDNLNMLHTIRPPSTVMTSKTWI